MIEVVNYSSLQRQYSTMHDHDTGMAAVHGARISPASNQPMEIHTSVIKNTFSAKSVPQIQQPQTKSVEEAFENRFDEGMDEDDFSDHDSHYSEDLDDIEFEPKQPEPDVTRQLLNFAEMVNADIKKFFGRKKDEDDACDIYEDKWITTKSGRELYYADLLKIAQGDNGDKSRKSSANSPQNVVGKEVEDNRKTFSGKMDTKLGLGPLNELFEIGLKQFMPDNMQNSKLTKKSRVDQKKLEELVPMHKRKLPTSFWSEPGGAAKRNSKLTVLQSSNPPDFSDLLESWHVEDRGEFSGEMSSSEVSMSPESVIEHV